MSHFDYLTTSEAAQLLNVSRSTVSRMFDAGSLQGKVNRITGERSISRAAVDALMRAHGFHDNPLPSVRQVLVAARDRRVPAALDRLAQKEPRIRVTMVNFGLDALVRCATNRPALLVVADDLPDIRADELINALRRNGIHRDLRVLSLTHSAAPTPLRHGDRDHICLSLSEFDEEDFIRRVHECLDLAPEKEPSIADTEHRRSWPRIAVDWPCRIAVYPLTSPGKCIPGTAKVRNISRGGACVEAIQLENPIPLEPFRMRLEVDSAELRQWKASCRVLRLESNGSLRAGLQFLKLSLAQAGKIEALAG